MDRFALALALLCLASCSPTFAPPVRTGVSSVPLKAQPDEVAMVLGWSGAVGHLRVLTPISEELGLETSFVANLPRDSPEQHFVLAGPGVYLRQQTPLQWLTAGISTGLGFGCGGARAGEGGCERRAGGISFGFDLSAGELWGFHAYLANRLQLGVAEDVPATLWGLHVAGLQWDAWDDGLISLEVGPWWYENRVEKRDAMIVTLGLGSRWDTQ